MSGRVRDWLGGLGAAVLGLAGVQAGSARAQDNVDRVLSVADVVDSEQCAVLHIGFNLPINVVSSFPEENGDDLRIRVAASAAAGLPETMQTRESLHPPASTLAQIANIEFDGMRPEGPTLEITFRRPVHFHVGVGHDFRSVVVAVSDHADPACTPSFKPLRAGGAAAPPPLVLRGPLPAEPPPGPRGRAAAESLPAPTAGAELNVSTLILQRMHDARTALTAKDYPRAIQLLTAIVDAPDNAFTPEALELLGLARERNNQLAHAKAEYEEYLRRYPKGPDADRVRQRLAGVLAVGATPKGGLRQAGQPATGKPPGLAWEVGGSFSEYYFFDDGFQRSELLPSSTQVGTSTTDNQLNQNQLLSTVDGLATVRGPGFIARGRVSATYTEDFLEGGHNQTTLSALYVEAMDTHQNLFGRVGRQTRSTGGVFGRFDGGLFSVRVAPEVKLEVATGYPVDSSRNLFLQSDRPFVAADVALGRFLKSWDANLYFVDQANHSLVDRQAVGGEVRYLDMTKSLFGSVDYDLKYRRVDLALLNASTSFKDRTTLSVALDYRQSPLMTTNNALIGQNVADVTDLIPTYGVGGVYRLAADRTAQSETATLSLAHPITPKLSLNLDATVDEVGATPASGGVPAEPSSGLEKFATFQLINTDLLVPGDLGIVGFRYGDTAQSNRYVFDLNTRFPITHDIRINPRLILDYRDNKTRPGTEFSTKPSVRLNIYFHKHYQFELETGGEWTVDRSPTNRDTMLGVYSDVGLRADF